MSPSDSVLLERWTAGRDADAFAELVSRYSGMVYGTCRRVLGNASDAEDVVQECFLELAESGRRVTHSLGGWLHTVAVRRSLDRRKADARRRHRESKAAAEPAQHEPTWDDIRPHVDEAIDALPPKLRDAIVLRFLEGRTHEGVAQRLSLPKSTVEYRLHRGLERIRRHLTQRGIVPGLAGLGVFLEANMAEAAPTGLTASLGKLAIAAAMQPGAGAAAGAGSAAAKLAAAGGSLVMKKALVGLAVLVLIGVGYGVVRMRTDSKAVAPVVVAEAEATVAPAARPPVVPEEATAQAETVVPAGAAPAAEAEKDLGAKETPAPPAAPTKKPAKEGRDKAIAGRVVDAAGAGVAAARVAAAIEGFKTEGFDATADGEGRFRIEGLPDASFVVGAASLEQGSGYVAGVKAGATDVLVRLEAGGRIAGRVYDESSGEGIPGATVCARDSGQNEGSPLGIVQGRVQLSGASDADGRYEIPVKAGVEHTVTVSEVGVYLARGPYPKPVQAARGKTAEGIDFALSRGGTVTGTVFDAEDKPRPDVEVVLLALTGKPSTRDTASGPDGAYVFAGVKPGDAYVVIGRLDKGAAAYSSPRFAFPEDADTHTVDLHLGHGVDVAGRVEDQDGKAVANVDVTVAVIYDADAGWSMSDDYVATATDAQGAFVMRGLVPGSYTAVVAEEQYERNFVPFAVPEEGEVAEVLVRVQEKKPGFVSGRVVDPANKPVYPARVAVSKPSGEFLEVGSTDANGAFRIEGLGSVESVRLDVLEPGRDLRTHAGEYPVNTSDIVIVVNRAGRVRGIVVDAATNKPVPNAEVNVLERWAAGGGTIYPPEGTWMAAGEDGSFEMEIQFARVRLGARAKGYSVASIEPIDVAEGEVVEGIVIALRQGNEVRGAVTDAGGAPLANARVGVVLGRVPLSGEEALRQVTTDADGRYSLGSFEPGSTVTVGAWADGHAVGVAIDRPVASNGPTEINLALAPEGRIDGAIEGALPREGAPVVLARYLFRESPELAGFTAALVPPNGRFSLNGLPAGSYRLTIQSHNPTQFIWSGSVDVVAGQTTALPIAFGPTGGLMATIGGLADASDVGLVLSSAGDPETEIFAGGFNAEGRCEMQALPAGVYEARLVSRDGQRLGDAVTVTIAEGAQTEVVIPAPQ